MISQRYAPKDSFADHQMNTPWDPLHRASFNGEALWTYLTIPFLLAMGDVRGQEPNTGAKVADVASSARAYSLTSIDAHSQIEDFFFGGGLDASAPHYTVNIAGGFGARS